MFRILEKFYKENRDYFPWKFNGIGFYRYITLNILPVKIFLVVM
jgi:hypothetical protein